MKDKPILFSTPMVQAVLDGRKTQTRRLTGLHQVNENPTDWEFIGISPHTDIKHKKNKPGFYAVFQSRFYPNLEDNIFVRLPYGPAGTPLWVREAWNKWPLHSDKPLTYHYRASIEPEAAPEIGDIGFLRWKPSIHMPKAASRIWLRNTGVRVERLHDITPYDIVAEGIKKVKDNSMRGGWLYKYILHADGSYTGSANPEWPWQQLWVYVNGRESWDKNPFVFVTDFSVESTTGKPENESNPPLPGEVAEGRRGGVCPQ